MSEEQNTLENGREEQDANKVTLGDSSLQSAKEFKNDKMQDDYYAVDNPKKEINTTIGDGEMRDEGIVGIGNLPEESPFSAEDSGDEQDKAEQQDAGG